MEGRLAVSKVGPSVAFTIIVMILAHHGCRAHAWQRYKAGMEVQSRQALQLISIATRLVNSLFPRHTRRTLASTGRWSRTRGRPRRSGEVHLGFECLDSLLLSAFALSIAEHFCTFHLHRNHRSVKGDAGTDGEMPVSAG